MDQKHPSNPTTPWSLQPSAVVAVRGGNHLHSMLKWKKKVLLNLYLYLEETTMSTRQDMPAILSCLPYTPSLEILIQLQPPLLVPLFMSFGVWIRGCPSLWCSFQFLCLENCIVALNGILKKPNATLEKAEKAEQCLPLHYEVSVNGGCWGSLP